MSSPNKLGLANSTSEESGWTMYFDYFFNSHVDYDHHKCSSMSLSGVACSSSSHVSGAASLVEKKLANTKQLVDEDFGMKKDGKKSSFKKRKDIITALIDDALEDTATSPLNGPQEKDNT
ncbi:hypothetical protein RJT34_30211 [Clitoria ternatea]|uniref:Uncharacterized protein n=1 Tax=Clitoria ternatea TaxID=43366 RepID=A0AAN9EU66_CLITE